MGERDLPQTSTQFAGSTQPRITLIGREFAAIRRALLDLIRIRFPNEFKDFATSGIGLAIIDVVAYSHAQISYYVDAHANEFFIPTARTFGGMRRLTAALNYRMRSATAAGVSLTFFPSPPQTGKIRVDAGSTLRAKNGTIWEILEDVIVPENAAIYPDPDTEATDLIPAAEGEPKTSRFVSDGTVFQKFLLPDDNVVEGSISVKVSDKDWYEADSVVFSEGYGFAVDRVYSDGSQSFSYTLTRLYPRADNFLVTVGSDPNTAEIWEQVDDFSASGPTDNVYVLTIDPTTGVAQVTFGDGTQGRVPPADELVVFTYNVIGPQERYQVVLEPDGLISIRFGDGNGGVIPPEGEEIVVEYKAGGGLKGNIDIGGIDTTIQGTIVGVGTAVEVRVQNQEAAGGAEEAETVDHARLFAPKVAASTGRASTQDDYDGLLNTFTHPVYGAVAFGKGDLHSDFPESNQVDLVLWTRDSNGRIFPAPTAFREAVKVYMDSRADICHLLRHKGGDTIYVDIAADVAIKSTLEVSEILATARAELLNYFLSTQVLPGVDVHFSQLITVVQSILGVDYLTLTSVRLSRRQRFVYFIGDGNKSRFRTESFFGYDADLGSPIIPGTFQIIVNDKSVTDDSQGNLVGDVDEGAAANAVVYDDTSRDRADTVTAGPRFFTPLFAYRTFVINEFPQTTITDVVLPDSDILTIPVTLIVTDGVQYVYDDGTAVPSAFVGDVAVGVNQIIDDGSGKAKISFKFASAATGPIVAYYIAAVPVCEFDGNPPAPTSLQQQVAAIEAPVRPTTLLIRHDQDLVVDDGNGNMVYGQNETDTRDVANTAVYRDEEVEGEDISQWLVPLTGGLRYRGRLRNVPQIPVLSPQLRPGNVIISDGTIEIQDDGLNNLQGTDLDGNGDNRVFYEDTQIDEIIASLGQSVYTNVDILPNAKIPPVHGAAAPFFEIVTQVQDPGDSVFYEVRLQDNVGNGVLVDVSALSGPNGPYLLSGTVNYAAANVSVSLKYNTTSDVRAAYIVRGGTFDFLLNAAFSGTPLANYRKATGGQFDVTFPSTNAGQPLQIRHDQALGGQFDTALADTPGVGDLVQFDYRFRYELLEEDGILLSVDQAGTRRVSGTLQFKPVKRGSITITARDSAGQEMQIHDDGAGVFVGANVASGTNYINYDTGVYDVSFGSDLLVGSQVLAEYVAYLEPDDVVPILDDQMADVGFIDLTHIEPTDIN